MTTFMLDILGNDYLVKFGSREEVRELGVEYDIQGETDFYKKLIIICTDLKGDKETQERQLEEILIHELTHAFLFESGLVTYGVEETLPEWFSIVFKKMLNCFEVGIAHLTQND